MNLDEYLARLARLSPNLIDAALAIANEERAPLASVIELLFSPHASEYQPVALGRWERSIQPTKFH